MSARASSTLTADRIIELLGLVPLPGEGGYYRETYRSADRWVGSALPRRYGNPEYRSAGTCIHYLLTEETFSALHRLRTDEVYHFYRGDPVELVVLDETGVLQPVTLGSEIESGQYCQEMVPAGAWQGSRLAPGGRWALLGTTMSPGFEFADFELADRLLLDRFPQHAEILAPLMPSDKKS